MRLRKSLMVLIAVMLPVASISLLEGTAFAKKVTGTGNTTCSFGGTINFNPPLTQNGTPGVKKEVTTVTASLGSCSRREPGTSGFFGRGQGDQDEGGEGTERRHVLQL